MIGNHINDADAFYFSKDLQIELKRDYNNARYKKGDQVLDGTEW